MSRSRRFKISKTQKLKGRPHKIEKCPSCDKKLLHINYEVRKNSPFGKRSSSRYFPKKREEVCTNVKVDKKTGKELWRCGYKAVYTSPPLMNVDKEFGTRQERS